MSLRLNIPEDAAAAMLRERISEYLVNNVEIKRSAGKFNAMPDRIEARAQPLAELAYAHFTPKLTEGAPALKTSFKAMAKPGSALSKAFATAIESNQSIYPHSFFTHEPDDKATGGFRFSAQKMADRLVAGLCIQLEGSMLVSSVQAAPVTAITPQAKALADKLAARETDTRGAA